MKILSDIEIAQSCTPKPITEIAKTAGVDNEYLELYGNYKAKIDNDFIPKQKAQSTTGGGTAKPAGK